MKIKTEKSIHVDHIIWQFSSACAGNCPGCYLKEGLQSVPSVGQKLLPEYLEEGTISCDQLTLSLGLIPQEYYFLLHIFSLPEGKRPTIYMTAKNQASLAIWAKMTKYKIPGEADVITLSENSEEGTSIELIRKMVDLNDQKLIFNLLADKGRPSDRDKEFIEVAHHVHLILKKPVLGGKIDRKYFGYWNDLREHIPPDKLIEDRCIVEGRRFRAGETTGCHAGLSVITVWPDNAVTGCPYDSRQLVPQRGIDLTQNILALQKPPSKECTLITGE